MTEKTHREKDREMGHEDTGRPALGHQDTETPGHRDNGTQGHSDTGIKTWGDGEPHNLWGGHTDRGLYGGP